jgi:hypothetical protein
MDRLIIERWRDVVGLIEAQRQTQDRIEEMIDVVGERVARWAQGVGFEVETDAKYAEFRAWRPSWADKRRGAKVQIALGGFCPREYRRTDSPHPYLWVYTEDLEKFRVREPERIAFAKSLRRALGDAARSWEATGVDDATQPLGRYLSDVADAERLKIISSPDALFEFVTEQYPNAFELADVIEGELVKLQK